jgi:hypothetical protein
LDAAKDLARRPASAVAPIARVAMASSVAEDGDRGKSVQAMAHGAATEKDEIDVIAKGLARVTMARHGLTVRLMDRPIETRIPEKRRSRTIQNVSR